MKKITILTLSLLFSIAVLAQENINIVPKPLSVKALAGKFILNKNIKIISNPAFSQQADWLAQEFEIDNSSQNAGKSKFQTIELRKNTGKSAPKESYQLSVSPEKISITANDTQGIVFGIESLLQLAWAKPDAGYIPCVNIEDAPRFSYRGMMLDVSRHFNSFEFVKRYIDLLALYKFNTLHMHLTDGAGWRLEIKKYPELTSKAAWREGKTWKEWHQAKEPLSEQGNPNAVGGYYTQKQAKELVKYAAVKGINIIPEIEFPGHSDEVLKVYPQLGCQVDDANLGGDFCPSNPQTFQFACDVLSEVMAVFPSPYIHIGGDEANKNLWKKCPRCQAYMKEKDFTDIDQLQSDFIKKLEQFVTSKHRKIMGWDEILQGGLAPEATVMSWRGEQGGIDAAKMKHHVVMTPGQYLYFDKYQQDPSTQPEAIGGYLTVEKVYDYEPVPSELNAQEAKYILGAQANLFAEYIPTQEQVEYMTFPRALSLSEVNWTDKKLKNWEDFEKRLQGQYWLMQRKGINYARPSMQVGITPKFDKQNQQAQIRLSSQQQNPQIYYTTDGSTPNDKANLYSQPFEVKGSKIVKAAIIENGKLKAKPDTLAIDFHKAIGKKVIYNTPYSQNYVAQKDSTLVNGYRGGISFGDGQWQGFETVGMDVTVDMNDKTTLNTLQISFMQLTSQGIYIPSYVSVSLSDDGKNFDEIQKIDNDIPTSADGLVFKTFKFDLKGKQARYIRVKAHDQQRGYLFGDEIIVY